MAKAKSIFRSNKSKLKRLKMIEDHTSGNFGNANDRRKNKKYYDSFAEHIRKEGLEDEFINN
jgi:hypothetical protein